MLRIGLTGGIGSGKSTAAARLSALGASVLDADRIAREVVAPGSLGLQQVLDRFGPGVLGADGALDRSALGRVVFADPGARSDLEAITHPLVRARTDALMRALPRGAVIVHDVPLLVELGYAPRYHLVMVVGASRETRLARLEAARGMSRADALARMGSQATDEARRAVADVWVDNEGDVPHLLDQVDGLWTERLTPYRDNLAAGRALPTAGAAPLSDGEVARVLGRLRWALGKAYRQGERAGPADDAPTLHVEVVDPDDPAAQQGLNEAGMAATGHRRYAGCDPGRPVLVRLGEAAVGARR